jgi:hypothetical protein
MIASRSVTRRSSHLSTSSVKRLKARSVNGYYTARRTQGVNVHFDRHDVFAIQIHGSKRWFYREDSHVLSRAMRHQSVPPVDEKFTGWQSVLLKQGDVFYCRRDLARRQRKIIPPIWRSVGIR